MNEIFTGSVFFGVCITIGAYQLGCRLQKKWKLAVMNPLLIAAALIIAVLLIFRIDYAAYEEGGRYISVFLTPVTVCLALPLYRQIQILKKNVAAVLCGVFSGCIAHGALLLAMAALFHLDRKLFFSMLPKSITTPIAVGISAEIGGIEQVTIVAVIVTGIIGAAIGPWILKILRIREPVAQGLAMGSAAHAVGTSRAMEMGETQGAMSSLAIVVNGIFTVLVLPVLTRFL